MQTQTTTQNSSTEQPLADLRSPPVSTALARGHLLPALLATDSRLYGRWDFLADCFERGSLLPREPGTPSLPQIVFSGVPDKATHKMLTDSLDAIPAHGHGGWQGWGGSEYFRFFLEYLLHGFGHAGHREPPTEPAGCAGATERLAEALDLALWQTNPHDYLGELLAANAYGKKQGFFPTPHTVAELMTRMLMDGGDGRDTRILTVCDPCVGTGRLLLHASNHSMRLYGMDIDPTLCLATLVNGYLFVPWLVRPLPFLDPAQYDESCSAALSDAMTAQAPPHQAQSLSDTEHDAGEQWRFEPVKKRRKRQLLMDSDSVRQGMLF